MLDIKFIRKNPEKVKEGCRKKQVKIDIDRLLKLDKERRDLLQEIEQLRAGHKDTSSELVIGNSEEIAAKGRGEKEEIKTSEEKLKKISKEFNDLMLQVPNLPLDDVLEGKDEKDNKVIKKWGKIPKFGFKPKDYMEIAEKLDLIDVKRAAKVSGTRFGYLKNEAVLLEFALINLAFNTLTKEGFIPVITPVMIKPKMMQGMGYVERGREEIYFLEKDNLYLEGTTEQVIGPMHADEIFLGKDLPKRYVGFSTWFRREAGSYGKDTIGIFRSHQFDGVEMFSFTKPEDSKNEHKLLLSMEEKLVQALNLPYQVVQICTGDLGDPAAAKFDIECWMPGQNQYRETHSTSNCTDFQTRRLNVRYREKGGNLEFVHTLNGTAFAIGRTLIAIIENYQQKDGSIIIPEVLKPYMNNLKVIKK